MEPFYVRQASLEEAAKVGGATEWAAAAYKEAKAEGAQWLRATVDHGCVVVEGWKQRPADEGDPRFFFAAT